MNILVTGSSGTIGTRLCERLIKKGHNVQGIDIKENKWSEEINKITEIIDLTKDNCLDSFSNQFDIIIHLAANARVYDLVVKPEMAFDNIKMVYNILEFVRNHKIPKVVFASSREVYGNSNTEIHSESDVHLDLCESPYSASKISGEVLVQSYSKCYDIDFIIFRFSNVYGMYDESDRVIPLFIRKCLNKEDLTVFGEEKLLDFTFIDDTVSGVIYSIENFNIVKNKVYNLSGGQGVKILDVAKIIKEKMKTDNKIHISSNRPGEVVKYIADITNAKNNLNYNPKTKIDEGIEFSIDWYKKNISKT